MSNIDKDKTLPQIHQREIVAESRFFRVERVDLEFTNGATRQFERMAGYSRGAVMIVAIQDGDFLLVREYAAGTHTYELGFPKGLIDQGESILEAANRELKEEAGFGARELEVIHKVNMAPTFFNAQMNIVIAHDLYPETLPGDEPEPLELVRWPIEQADELLAREDFIEARCIAALFLAQKWLKEHPDYA